MIIGIGCGCRFACSHLLSRVVAYIVFFLFFVIFVSEFNSKKQTIKACFDNQGLKQSVLSLPKKARTDE